VENWNQATTLSKQLRNKLTERHEFGRDIEAACGQLAGRGWKNCEQD